MSTVTVRSESGDTKLVYEPGVTLLDVLSAESFDIAAPCGGQGKCGKCAAECPVGAIPASDPTKTDKDKCITCMRCVAVCPHFARSLNPVMLAAAKAGLKKSCSERKEPELFL